ncbi:hypothetical protein KC19_5G003000 [Ceratodon purpureus]|uniref:ABC transporter domain-containing protein n=1 Tax=Ceratodon purpureus TaxID=3225 RepID=A0A8T0HXB8_CERPU|nr:hypothetical protein KC19_5G003000 [Ceratodon purpureus]
MAWARGMTMLAARRRSTSRPWTLIILCILGIHCRVCAQPAIPFPPPAGFALPPPGVPAGVFTPPGLVLPPPGVLLPPPPGQYALPPGYAYPPGYVNPVPPGTPDSVARDMVYKQIQDMSKNITANLQQKLPFCITDGEKERQEVFGFPSDSPFLNKCFQDTEGTVSDRLCTLAEVKLYFDNIKDLDHPKPNLNCNSSSWNSACEAGWAAQKLTPGGLNSDIVPVRIFFRKTCCDGFFCPRGLTCMMPCPLGAYCPQATHNETTGLCDPYGYPVPPGANQECGGADKWADVSSTQNIFCPAGKYCPTTIEANNCTEGHYCRLGSTREERCSSLTSCSGVQREKENLTAVGGLIIAILTITLLLVFTCSDWLMDIRKRRKTKARDLAQRQAVERISGLERWKQAKDAAKRGASNFSRKLSKGVSRKRPAYDRSEDLHPLSTFRGAPSQLSPLGLMSETINEDGSTNGAKIPLSPVPLGTLTESSDEGDLYAPIPAPPVVIPDFVPDDGSTAVRKSKEGITNPLRKSKEGKGKKGTGMAELRTSQSQIFAYAYGQIEKEKAFGSGKDIEMGGEYGAPMVGRMRPPIELSFVDLSLFLKGTGKKILSNVTGKLSPGRVTAVMGPSGAGKTTFLNALAGKATHSRTTGAVFINGKPDSIQSYKSIIGFVPQDDIVHGNLTVEENLWFSASYRLPVGMPKCDRVLVVERIIAALGLGPIRDSQVGTVEKRGISGGQRKRVNVGLEMVMEPSLLILDEPTSGLDSTSSRLVLQALRREASMGVNVGVVLHQPSYGLFKMFDDVMFLAKGGRTVYLGPVSEVEDYFSGLGLIVPERINPPDHYMDALEGIAVPIDQPDFDPKNLPVMWMINKGLNIPPDLSAMAAELKSGMARGKSFKKKKEPKRKTTFIQDFWNEVRAFFIVKAELIVNSFRRVENKSGRVTPGFFAQFVIIVRRLAKQRFREARVQFQDYIILLMAGACLGPLSNMRDTSLGTGGYFYTLIALALLVMIASLRTFSNDKLTFWRESASGINRVAYFLAKDVVDLFNVVIKPVIYLSMFFFFSNPRSTFVSNFTVTLVLVYCVTGIAYICSILLQPAPAQLWSVFLPILATLIISVKRTGILLKLQYLSYARYANEAYVIANAANYKGVWVITRCAVLQNIGYSIDHWIQCLVVLVFYGLVARAIALICLFTSNRSKQK